MKLILNKKMSNSKVQNRYEKLIKSIKVNKANFEYIAKTGKISGSLYIDLKEIFEQYDKQVFSDLWPSQKG